MPRPAWFSPPEFLAHRTPIRQTAGVMEPTLDEAIQSVFGSVQPQAPAQEARKQPGVDQARTQFDAAQSAMQQGNWENFGKAMDALKRLLNGPPPAVQQ